MEEKSEKKNCVRCGKDLSEKQKLRCDSCIKLVDAELRGETDKDWRFFFKWNLKHKK